MKLKINFRIIVTILSIEAAILIRVVRISDQEIVQVLRLKYFDQLQIPCFIILHIYNAKLNFVGKCNYKHILYVQEVVTRPKILNRIFYPNEFM